MQFIRKNLVLCATLLLCGMLILVTGSARADASTAMMATETVKAGQEAILVITRTDSDAYTHRVIWTSPNGGTAMTGVAAGNDTALFTIPTGWASGEASATLVTYANGQEIGRMTCVFTITGGYNGVYSNPYTADSNYYINGNDNTETPAQLQSGVVRPTGGQRQLHMSGTYEIQELTDRQFSNLFDGNERTVYSYTQYLSCRRDDIPELSLYFNSVSLDSMWIRSGNRTSEEDFMANARPTSLEIVVTTNGEQKTFTSNVTNVYTSEGSGMISGYQSVSFKTTLTNVTQVDIFIRGIKAGDSDPYNVCISDLLFYHKNGTAKGE